MALTESQRTTLAAHIRANTDPDVEAALSGRNDTELTRLYNLDSTFYAWRQAVQPNDYRLALDWTEVDNLTAGRARIWEWLTQNMAVSYDASQPNVRQGLNDAFLSSPTTKTAMIAASKRFATVAEEVYVSGTGTEGSPGDLDFVGRVTTTDIGRALNENP